MPEVECPSCGQHIDVFFYERERRIEAQRRSAKLLSEQSKEAGAMVEAGRTVEQVAEHFGVTVERARSLSREGGFFSHTAFDHATIQRLYAEGVRADDIAEELGCHVTTVYRVLKNDAPS